MPYCRTVLCCLLALAPGATQAQRHATEAGAKPGSTTEAALRYPQPVRAGDLHRRYLLRPIPAQHVLGRVAGLVRAPDGAVLMVVHAGGLLGFGTRPVAVPLTAVALLGEHVALMDLTPEQFDVLPTFDPASTTPVPPDDTLRVGLTRPFH